MSGTYTPLTYFSFGASPKPFRSQQAVVLFNVVSASQSLTSLAIPCVFAHLELQFEATPTMLASLTAARSFALFLSLPFFTWAAHRFNRRLLLAAGCGVWALFTLAMGFAQSFYQLPLCAAVIGVAFAATMAANRSLLAEVYPAEERTNMYKVLEFCTTFGALIGAVFATSLSKLHLSSTSGPEHDEPADGWRYVFIIMGGIIGILVFAILAIVKEPRKDILRDSFLQYPLAQSIRWADVKELLTNRAFLIIVLQGSCTVLPWEAVSFLVLWLQYIGVSSVSAGLIFGSTSVAMALGAVFGRWIGDAAHNSRRIGGMGRLVVAHLSIIVGLPLVYTVFTWVPDEPKYAPLFLVLVVATAFVTSWASAGCALALISSVVDDQSQLFAAYTVDGVIEGTIGAMGSLVAGLLAEYQFGYVTGMSPYDDALGEDDRVQNIDALQQAMLYAMGVPWAFSFLLWFWMYVLARKAEREATVGFFRSIN